MNSEVTVINPPEILDIDASNNLRREIDNLLANSCKNILLNFADVSFMNSSGLGALVAILKNVRTQGGKLYLCSISDRVKIIFSLSKLDRVFQIFDSQEEFEEKVLKVSQ